MSGHSKWASIKHKKAATDAKKGKVFTKIIREIMMAAKTGGPNPDTNASLRMTIDRAKGENMPNDNILRAIKKGSGEDGGVSLEQVNYEGYGPAGVAIYVEALSDNKNRSVAEIRTIFARHNGNLGSTGCVAWMFERKGIISVKKEKISEDDLLALILDAGAEDMKTEGDQYDIICEPSQLEAVKKALDTKKIAPDTTNVSLVAKTIVRVEGKDAEQLVKLMDELEESDDVQRVYGNFDIPDDILETIAKQ